MEAEAPFQLLDYLGPLFTLAISIAGLILLVRLIKRNRHRFQPSNAKETRTTVSGSRYFEAAAPADLFPPSEPRKAVRYYYRCFLRTCQKMGVFFPSSADSQTIEQQSQKFFRPESLGQLRQVRRVYIKARYSDDPVQEQDVQQIKSAYEYLRMKAGRDGQTIASAYSVKSKKRPTCKQVGLFMLLYHANKLASDFQQLLLELFF